MDSSPGLSACHGDAGDRRCRPHGPWTPAWKRTMGRPAAGRRPGPAAPARTFSEAGPAGRCSIGHWSFASNAASWSTFSFVYGVGGGGGPGVWHGAAAGFPTGAVIGLACSSNHLFAGWRDARPGWRRQGPQALMRARPLSVAARGGPAHVLGNIYPSFGCQANTASPIGQAAKKCGTCLRRYTR